MCHNYARLFDEGSFLYKLNQMCIVDGEQVNSRKVIKKIGFILRTPSLRNQYKIAQYPKKNQA